MTIVDRIAELPEDWHGSGSLGTDVLRAIERHAAGRALQCTVETGAGKSTLLLSHLSPQHWVFALDHGDSLSTTLACPLLRRDVVRVVEGPTQLTLRDAALPPQLQLALIDGPHGYPFPELEYYALYPKIAPGGVLIVDDIHIPTVRRLYEFVAEDTMWRPLEIVRSTAFLERTDAPTFDPLADGWWLQRFNERRFPVREGFVGRWRGKLRRWLG